MKKARSEGKELREAKLQKEGDVLALLCRIRLSQVIKWKSSANHVEQPRNRRRTESIPSEDSLKDKLAKKSDIQVNKYIAVACDDAW